MRYLAYVLLALLLFPSVGIPSALAKSPPADIGLQIEALFDPSLETVSVKLAVDELVDPSTRPDKTRLELDKLTAALQAMLEGTRNSHEKLKVLQRFLYQPGAWNGNRPFAYDMADPTGRNLSNKLLGKYLETRLGNCVTMPMLVMILGQRIGLDMTLATAPHHVFVKFTDEQGKVWNLEATSGAGYTRDIWYRKNLPMTEKAVASGTYMRPLTATEVKALIATLLVESHMQKNQPEDAIVTASAIIKHDPANAILHVWRGSAFAQMLRRDVVSRYGDLGALPPEVRDYADALFMSNEADFAEAEALGWTEKDGEMSQ